MAKSMNSVVTVPSVEEPPNDTRTLVKRVADELLTEGVRPTVASIRSRIGRGSASTINQALHEWWQELSRRLAAAHSRPDLPQPVAKAADQLWDTALEHADKALAEYRSEADGKVAKAAEIADAALLARNDAELKLQAFEQDYRTLEATRLDLDRRLTVETERRQVAEGRIHETQAEAERRVGEVRERVRQLEELLNREQERYDSMERRFTQVTEDHKMSREKLEAKYKTDVANWRKAKTELLAQNQALHEQLAESHGRLVTVREQLNESSQALSSLRLQYDPLLGRVAELQQEAASAKHLEESRRGELQALRQALNVLESERQTLRRELDVARQSLLDKEIQTA